MKYLTVGEVAERLCVSKAVVYRLCSMKTAALAYHKFGVGRGTIRVSEAALDEYLARSLVESFAPPPPRKKVGRPAPRTTEYIKKTW